jgi:hypothetical protein
MIRNIALWKFRPGTMAEQVDALMQAILALPIPGLRHLSYGPDLGLREGNMSYAVVYDFEDEASYRAFDTDLEHDRIRRELAAPILEQAERCQ